MVTAASRGAMAAAGIPSGEEAILPIPMRKAVGLTMGLLHSPPVIAGGEWSSPI